MDTIISYSGGSLPCAIGIVRLSGDDSWDIFDKIFVTKNKKEPKKMLYGSALSRDGKVIDRCLAVLFTEKSYTGEKMVEIYCHGSKAVVEEVLRSGQQAGARLAIAATHLEEKLENADFLVTGEGCSDAQTDNGKLCAVVAQTCRKHNVPCILLSGKVLGKNNQSFDKVCATVPEDMPFEKIKPQAAELLRASAVRLAETLKLESLDK